MNEQSPELQKVPYKHYDELNLFETRIDISMSMGLLDDVLTVRDEQGNCPIVVALGEEKLYFLVERVKAIGGCANILIKMGDQVTMIASEHFNGGTSDAEDLSDISEWENGDTTIAMFVTYLRTKPNGVIMPRSLPKGPETKMLLGEKPVSMESIPALV
ncbi:hypothetical protein [Bifidobacterium breve]|uniref:hypothetical protein n=1 Tax=Bifidobacterium breve TaxID=1685 RepID=UPI00254A1D77|nr:hypothetical protein [Bifidobacterium breve]MDK8731354.1 hypothetical protein [Bifidobacterium breve]